MARATIDPIADLRTIRELYRILRTEKPDIFLAYNMKPIVYAGLQRGWPSYLVGT